MFDYVKEFPTARKELAQWLAEGKLQRKETIVKGGLKAAEKALLDLFEGVNTGKQLAKYCRVTLEANYVVLRQAPGRSKT